MSIDPSTKNLEQLFSGLDTRYSVPEYQRDYSWSATEIDALWSDLAAAAKQDSDYFVGSVVLSSESSQEDSFSIVDGQQRLATFSILFAALRDIASTFQNDPTFWSDIDRNETEKQAASALYKLAGARIFYPSSPDHYFLKLNKKDDPFFEQHVRREAPVKFDQASIVKKSENRISKARKAFLKNIHITYGEDPERLIRLHQFIKYLMRKIKVISIVVENDYDAFALFECLNYRGLDLSTADLLKNKLLMRASHEDRQFVYDRWELVIENLLDSRFDNAVDFLRYYFVAFYKSSASVTKRTLYKEFREIINQPSFEVKTFINELHSSSENFVFLTDRSRNWPSEKLKIGSLEQYLAELTELKFSICLPALLLARKFYSEADQTELARLSLTYLFRHVTIGGFSVGEAEQTFSNAVKMMQVKSSFSEIRKLFKEKDARTTDEEFRVRFLKFSSRDNSVIRYILTKIHLIQAGPEQIPKNDEIHVEHILPQDASKWLGNGFTFESNEPEDVIYSIGNCTLLNRRLNSSISNDIFDRKIDSYRPKELGSDGTTFLMTSKIFKDFHLGVKSWTVTSIKSRTEELADYAVRIWRF